MNQFTVTAPEAGFSGESCGVAFTGGVGRVTDATKESRAAIEYFRRRGYTLTSEGVDEDEQERWQEGPAAPPAEPFEPSEHNADEVIAYLDSLVNEDTHDPVEYERVIAAERDGKNRKTITEKGTAA
jgi:hypothetical protein